MRFGSTTRQRHECTHVLQGIAKVCLSETITNCRRPTRKACAHPQQQYLTNINCIHVVLFDFFWNCTTEGQPNATNHNVSWLSLLSHVKDTSLLYIVPIKLKWAQALIKCLHLDCLFWKMTFVGKGRQLASGKCIIGF